MGAAVQRAMRQTGQSTVEWIGLLMVVAALLAGLLAAIGSGMPSAFFAKSIAMRLLCAVGLSSSCGESGDLVAAYGPELAAVVERNAPEIVYESGMTALPVDFRSCRGRACANGPDSGVVWRSDTGEPAAAFVHVVDCRTELARTDSATQGYDCESERAGNLYVHYWLYYEDSTGRFSGTHFQVQPSIYGLNKPYLARLIRLRTRARALSVAPLRHGIIEKSPVPRLGTHEQPKPTADPPHRADSGQPDLPGRPHQSVRWNRRAQIRLAAKPGLAARPS